VRSPSIQWRYLFLTLPFLLQACQSLSTGSVNKTNGSGTQNSSEAQQSSTEPAMPRDQASQLPPERSNPSEPNRDKSRAADAPDIAQLPQSQSKTQPQTQTGNSPDTAQAHWPGSRSKPVRSPTRTGNLPFDELNEISGLAASGRERNRLWAINDSGNRPALYAFSREAKAIGVWHDF